MRKQATAAGCVAINDLAAIPVKAQLFVQILRV